MRQATRIQIKDPGEFCSSDIDEQFRWLDRVIEATLVMLLVFMPLSLGAVEAWSEMILIFLTGIMAIAVALRPLLYNDRFKVGWGLKAVIFPFVGLIILQMISMPAEQIQWISHPTAIVKTRLLGDLPNSESSLKNMTISFYPLATGHDFRLILSLAVIFLAVITTYRTAESIKRLLGEISVISGAIAVLALGQDLFGNGKIYWTIPDSGNGWSGPFINHSHYGQFMNLSIGAVFALILVKLHETFSRHRFVSLSAVIEKLFSREMLGMWGLIGLVILGAATIVVSLTRGGMFSMLIGGSITAILMARKRSLRGRNWLMVLMTLGVFICILYIGFESVYERLAALRNKEDYIGRWQIIKDISVCVVKFPLFGTGLGTHSVVYPMFDRSTISTLAGHAENEYFQLAEETGFIGLTLAIIFGIIIGRCYIYNIRHLHYPIQAAAYGLGFGLLTILIHSLSDFGQHIPANASLSAISCGLLVSITRIGKIRMGSKSIRPNSRCFSQMKRITVVIIIVAVWGWSLAGADRARRGENYWQKTLAVEKGIRQKNWQADNEDYRKLILLAQDATQAEPGNVLYRYWLNVYRWQAISRVIDPKTHEIAVTPKTLEFTQRIVEELYKTCMICPTYGAPYCMAGQLEMFILDHRVGERLIRRGYLLAPCDATVCFTAGLLDAIEGKFDPSYAKFERCLKLDGNRYADVAEVYIHQINRPDLAIHLAQDNAQRLFIAAKLLQANSGQEKLAAETMSLAISKLESECRQANAPFQTLTLMASIYNEKKQYAEAANCYRKILAEDCSRVEWRYQLAKTLAMNEQYAEAIHEARICLSFQPQMSIAKKLIEEICTRSGAMKDQ
jgi:hypothetical protein